MIWLILTILLTTLLLVIFRFFPQYGVNNLVAIIINYLVAGICGLTLLDSYPELIFNRTWFPVSVALGVFFVFNFLMMASSSQMNGVTMTSVANKMSLALPVIAGVLLYNDQITVLITIGIALAFASVILTSIREKSVAIPLNGYFLLALLFFCSGTIDIMMKYMQHTYLRENEEASFVITVFFSAAATGILWMLIAQRDRFRDFKKVNILAGIILGIPNFGSIYFLILALNKSGMQSASMYPVMNMGIVALSTLFGLLLFKEKLSLLNTLGILVALGSISLIAFG